jgi:hypothetical protein
MHKNKLHFYTNLYRGNFIETVRQKKLRFPINTTVNFSPVFRRRKTYDSSSVRPTNVYRTTAYYQPKTEIGKLTKNFPFVNRRKIEQ